jgi:hypothetical protein
MKTFDEWHTEQMIGEDKPCPHEKHERFARWRLAIRFTAGLERF